MIAGYPIEGIMSLDRGSINGNLAETEAKKADSMTGKKQGKKTEKGSKILLRAIMALLTLVLLVILVLLFRIVRSQNERVPEPAPYQNKNYPETIVAVGDAGYDPYTFLNEAGQASGFDVDMIHALADRMQVNVDIRLMTWEEAKTTVRDGKADILLGYEKNGLSEFETSIPLHEVQFVAYGNQNFSSIGSLYGKRLATIKDSGCIHTFLEPFELTRNIHYFDSYSEALQSVERGDSDYAIVMYTIGRRIVKKSGAFSVHAVGPVLLTQYQCYGLKAGDEELKNRLDKAMIQMMQDGETAAIRKKWLSSYVEGFSIRTFVSEHLKEVFWSLNVLAVLIILVIFYAMIRLHKSQKKALRNSEMLEKEVELDSMTRLCNHAAAETKIRRLIQDSRPGDHFAFMLLDIDRFKSVNDRYGHIAGDNCLTAFAALLQKQFREEDIVARFGGDEFCVFMRSPLNTDIIVLKADQVVRAAQGLHSEEHAFPDITVSMGVALYPKDGTDFETLYSHADKALYSVKASTRNNWSFYKGS